MDRPRNSRGLRIAVSVFFTLVAVALCALWARSYWYYDMVSRTGSNDMYTQWSSNWGYICFTRIDASSTPEVHAHGWRHQASSANRNPARFQWIADPELLQVNVPNWFLVLTFAALSRISWAGARFNVRTMLIATTLVALLLGVTKWANG
jgi:hypothetical protein